MATTRLQRYASGKTLDDATRERRHQKALDALEQDNHQEDPHANMNVVKKSGKKKALQLVEDTTSEESVGSDDSDEPKPSSRKKIKKKVITNRKKRSPSPGYFKLKFNQDFKTLIKLQQRDDPVGPNYVTAAAGPSKYPARNFCSVCGFPCDYKCAQCGTKFCSTKCYDIHKETRCLKFVR